MSIEVFQSSLFYKAAVVSTYVILQPDVASFMGIILVVLYERLMTVWTVLSTITRAHHVVYVCSLLQKIQSEPGWSDVGPAFAHSVKKLLENLLDYRYHM